LSFVVVVVMIVVVVIVIVVVIVVVVIVVIVVVVITLCGWRSGWVAIYTLRVVEWVGSHLHSAGGGVGR
jgi:hypothetical protein